MTAPDLYGRFLDWMHIGRRKPTSWGEPSVVGYMCLTDFECELGAAKGGNVVYPSIADLREHRSCVDTCGIAEVIVTGAVVIQEATFDSPTEASE